MKKLSVFLLAISLLANGCGSIVARKDASQIVQFKNSNIKAGNYNIIFYRLNYPENPHEKDKFYEEFDTLTSKMVAYNKDINIIIPLEFYQDLKNLQKREVREGEKVFAKHSFALDNSEKNLIDKVVNVKTPTDVGDVQKYLNKQVAYWLTYLKRPNTYDKNRYYTELDKDKLIDEVFQNRRFFSNTCFAVEDDFILETLNNQLISAGTLGFPLYINSNILPIDELKKLNSKIYLVDEGFKDKVIPEKILLIDGKIVKNVKDYEIASQILTVSSPLDLIPKLAEEDGLKIKDILDFTVKQVPNSVLKSANVSEKPAPRETINFGETKTNWRIE